jgi:hypothetical protein
MPQMQQLTTFSKAYHIPRRALVETEGKIIRFRQYDL